MQAEYCDVQEDSADLVAVSSDEVDDADVAAVFSLGKQAFFLALISFIVSSMDRWSRFRELGTVEQTDMHHWL